MTNKEAIEWIKSLIETMVHETSVGPFPDPEFRDEVYEALDMSIKALEQGPTTQERQAESDKFDAAFQDGYDHGYSQAKFDYEQEPFKPMVEIDLYSVIKQKYIEREVLDKIRAEIETKYGQCDICEYFEDYDYEENDISEYRQIGNMTDILQILDKYKAESEE